LLTSGEHVFVVGGGNSAGQAALHFAAFASRVTVVVRGSSLASSLSRYLIDQIFATENVEVLTRTEVTALHGDDVLRCITLTEPATGKQWTIDTRWLFVCIGAVPRTEWAPELGVMRDEGGYLLSIAVRTIWRRTCRDYSPSVMFVTAR
jgi:thioredoxin reductase (NADPH)